MSCTFYKPEVAVTTFQLTLGVEGKPLGRRQLPRFPTLVKGCERRFAIEDCETIRLCTPSYYREDGQSLVWDLQEGVIEGSPRVQERWDDPADLKEQQRINAKLADRVPLAKAAGSISTTSLRVREREQSSLTYGDNCPIWCASIKPRTRKQWVLWRDSLESSYDHTSTIRDPHMFAQALGAMAFEQRGLLGNPISFRNPLTGYTAQCPSLSVVYGPVIYVDDRRAYIEGSSSDLEFVARSIFTKTSEHRHQREYRFALLANGELEDQTLDLMVSTEMRWSVRERQGAEMSVRDMPSLGFQGCLPSPRILECFPDWPPTQSDADHSGDVFTSQVSSNFHLAGVHHKDTTTTRRASHTVEDVDYDYIERAIAQLPTSPSDARIVRFTLNAGPGSTFTAYDLDGLSGTYRLTKESGEAVLKAEIPEPDSGAKYVLIDNSGFDGSSFLSEGTNQLTLSCRTANPAASGTIKISDAEHKRITVTATSVDGTATSSFEVVFDSSLGINLTRTGEAPSDQERNRPRL